MMRGWFEEEESPLLKKHKDLVLFAWATLHKPLKDENIATRSNITDANSLKIMWEDLPRTWFRSPQGGRARLVLHLLRAGRDGWNRSTHRRRDAPRRCFCPRNV